MSPSEIAHDEELDLLDPLRHLMLQADENDPASGPGRFLSVLPNQPPSIHNEILKLSFINHQDTQQLPITISLSVSASPGCGGIAWPAGEVLSNYLVKKGTSYMKGRVILELGSGTGLVGLVAGKLGGRVWITDQAPLQTIMRRNVVTNDLEANVVVAELNWGCPIPEDLPCPDLILAADCVYFEPAFPLLVQTLSDLTHGTTEVLFCYKKRRKADKHFFIMLRKEFSWTKVEDDPDSEIYNREAISLLRLVKRIPSRNRTEEVKRGI